MLVVTLQPLGCQLDRLSLNEFDVLATSAACASAGAGGLHKRFRGIGRSVPVEVVFPYGIPWPEAPGSYLQATHWKAALVNPECGTKLRYLRESATKEEDLKVIAALLTFPSTKDLGVVALKLFNLKLKRL